MSHLVCIILTLLLRFHLSSENKKREEMKRESERTGVGKDKFEDWAIIEVERDGGSVKEKVDKAFLDLTDKENLAFRYVL